MIVEDMAAAIGTCARDALDDVMRALWAAHAAGDVTDDEAESLSVVIEARRRGAGNSQITHILPDTKRRPVVSCFKRAEARERSRRWAAAGRMPPAIAAKFTSGEQAALAVIAFEFSKRQFCDKSIGEIATMAGVSQSTVKRAMRQARFLGLLMIQERRLSRYRNETNIVRIIGKAWLSWLELRGVRGGVQRRPGTDTSGLRKDRSEFPKPNGKALGKEKAHEMREPRNVRASSWSPCAETALSCDAAS